jgi:rsbT co-antagonist protein RsbR
LQAENDALKAENERLKMRITAAEAAQQSLTAVFMQSPASISLINVPDLVMALSNDLNLRLLGRSADQVVGFSLRETFPGEEHRPLIELLEQVYQTGEPFVGREMLTRFDIDGTGELKDIWVDFVYQPIKNDQGEVERILSFAIDVTEKVLARQQVERLNTDLQQQIAERTLQLEQIELQQAAIRELSAPLLPLADRVLAMPLIGSIDSHRAQEIMETLLEGISAYQAEIAIIDITGVKVVDTQVAQALIRTAQAVKLLGARVVLTGIQPQIAQTLVHLGADLGNIITRSTLQSGIIYALHEAGEQQFAATL